MDHAGPELESISKGFRAVHAMLYRELGKTGIKVSVLGFGGLRFPMRDGHVIVDDAVDTIHRAFDLGVNFIDTAVGYCASESEVVVGRALRDRRDQITLSTKNNNHGNDPGVWRSVLENSMRKLGVDVIDLYNYHCISLNTFREWEKLDRSPIDEMYRAKDEGLIEHIGFSSHDKPENMIELLETDMFETLILQYNLLNTANEKVITHANRKGIGIIVMGPVGGGRLAAPSSALMKIIDRPVASTAELALRFVISNPGVSTALSGMSDVEMVEENVATASDESPLSREEKRQIEEALEEKKRLCDLYCTGCGYCMPCPNGVDIPGNFELVNYHRLYGLKDYAREKYASLGRKKVEDEVRPAWAEACIECGECEDKCPQNIEIRSQLKEADSLLSG